MRIDPKDGQIYGKCDLCNSEVKYGKGAYYLHKIDRYGISCCNSCWAGNWDGWNPSHEAFLLKKLSENNLPVPARNSKGWLPRE